MRYRWIDFNLEKSLRDSMPTPRPLVIVIMPPWPRGGSANLFEASVAAYSASGRDVYALLAPDNPANVTSEADRRFMLGQMSFSTAIGVGFLVPPSAYRARLQRKVHRLLGRRRTAIDFWAASVAARQLPAELEKLLRERPVEIIHIHHCWNLRLAARLATEAGRRWGKRPKLVCETHDVQSANKDVIAGSLWLNPKTDVSALIASEIRLCQLADLLLHINARDEQVFRERLPTLRHALVEPTISPSTEAALSTLRRQTAPPEGKLVYIATDNYWNVETTVWILESVIPLAPRLRDHIRIYGQIGEGVRRIRPDLFNANETLFPGSVGAVTEAYSGAKGILVPALGGSGSSIKLLEGLCSGLPMLGTSAVVRGLSPYQLARIPVRIHDDAAAFAQAALEIVDGAFGPSAEGTEIFDRHFSNTAYKARLSAILELDRASRETRIAAV